MKIFSTRKTLTPYEYPKYVDIHNKILMSPWSHFEVAMDADVAYWDNVATQKEKRIIPRLFKAFTLSEGGVEDYWRNIPAKYFKLPEIVDLATSCAHQETIHKRGYSYLEETLGLDSSDDFFTDEVAEKKLKDILENDLLTKSKSGTDLSIKELLLSLATFSGAVEGISLFSSFAILLWFCRSGKLTSSFQILSWSTLDEEMHSLIGISLFKDVLKEFPDERPTQEDVVSAFNLIVENEERFLRNAFQGEELDGINEDIAIDFLYHRANKKLKELGYDAVYNPTGIFRPLADYFYTNILGDLDTDFFVYGRNGQGYSAMIKQKFDSPNLEKYRKYVKA